MAWFWWVVVTIVSLAFAAALVFSPPTLASLWQAVRGLPVLAQVVTWVLFLPWMLAYWIWQSSWSAWLRLLLVVLLVGGVVFSFFPRQR